MKKTKKMTKKEKALIARMPSILSSLPERFQTKEAAEGRAEYLRIGTYKHAYVEEGAGCYIVIKRK